MHFLKKIFYNVILTTKHVDEVRQFHTGNTTLYWLLPVTDTDAHHFVLSSKLTKLVRNIAARLVRRHCARLLNCRMALWLLDLSSRVGGEEA